MVAYDNEMMAKRESSDYETKMYTNARRALSLLTTFWLGGHARWGAHDPVHPAEPVIKSNVCEHMVSAGMKWKQFCENEVSLPPPFPDQEFNTRGNTALPVTSGGTPFGFSRLRGWRL